MKIEQLHRQQVRDHLGLLDQNYGGWKTEADLDEMIRQLSSDCGYAGIRVLAYYIGKQDWASKTEMIFPFAYIQGGKVDFRKANMAWEERLALVAGKLAKYNLHLFFDVSDWCHWHEGASPFRSERNINGISGMGSEAAFPYYCQIVDRSMAVLDQVMGRDHYSLGAGNEICTIPDEQVGKWQKRILDYITSKGHRTMIMISAIERCQGKVITDPEHQTSQVDHVMAQIQKYTVAGKLCGYGDAKYAGKQGIIWDLHQISLVKHLQSGGDGYRPFVHNGAVAAEIMCNVYFGNDGGGIPEGEPGNDSRPASGLPYCKPMFRSNSDEELVDLVEYLYDNAGHINWWVYADLDKRIQRSRKNEKGEIEFTTDWSFFNPARPKAVCELIKRKTGEYPVNFGKFPKVVEPTEPEPEPVKPNPDPDNPETKPEVKEEELKVLRLFGGWKKKKLFGEERKIPNIRFLAWMKQWPKTLWEILKWNWDTALFLLMAAVLLGIPVGVVIWIF